jgi:uncharacterized protein YhaN
MKWSLNPFSQEKTRTAHPADEKNQNFTGVLHIVIEETVLAAAQWLIGFTKQALNGAMVTSHQPADTVVQDASATVEDLTSKVTTSIEQLCDRVASLAALEDRMRSVEQFIAEHPQKDSTFLDRSLSDETLRQEIGSLIQQIRQAEQQAHQLEVRVVHLEKLLAKYSVIPRVLKQQQSTIATLQSHIDRLEAPHQDSNHKPELQLITVEN